MIADKYASDIDDRQKYTVHGIELVRMPTNNYHVPVVATWESEISAATVQPNRVKAFWWSAGDGRWKVWSRTVENLDAHFPTDTMQRNSSNRIAVAARKNDTFIIYKRSIVLPDGDTFKGLLLDWLHWDSAQQALVSMTADPIVIPVSDLVSNYRYSGFYLWVGYEEASRKLLVLTQTFARRRLQIVPGINEFSITEGRIGLSGISSGSDIDKMGRRDFPGKNSGASEEKNGENSNDTDGPILPGSLARPVQAYTDYTALSLLSTQIPEDETDLSNFLADPTNWRHLEVGKGGYHFDALIRSGKLHCVYRENPNAIEITDPITLDPDITENQVITLPFDPTDDTVYKPLTAKTVYVPVNRAENNVIDDETVVDIPGGEHPQIHNINPLVITTDRIETGHLTITPPGLSMWGQPTQRQVIGNITGFQKLYFKKTDTGWLRKRLFTISSWPRYLWPQRQNRYTLDGTTVGWALLTGFRPIYLVGFQPGGPKTPDYAVFLHHRHDYEGVFATNFRMSPDADDISAHVEGYDVIDINHKQIPFPDSLTPETPAENHQFNPFVRDNMTVDNTLGGCLAVEKGSQTLSFFAYTDMGDGGCRVIYDEDLPQPDS